MNTHVDIRHATSDDARLLADLGARAFADAFGALNAEEDMAAYLESAFGVEVQAAEIADPRGAFLIADVGGVPAGYARLRLGNPPEAILGTRPMEIVRMYADGPWVGRGVGSALMAACIHAAEDRAVDAIWLSAWEKNPRAIAFYEKWGFVAAGKLQFRLGNDVQNDVLMVRMLPADQSPEKSRPTEEW